MYNNNKIKKANTFVTFCIQHSNCQVRSLFLLGLQQNFGRRCSSSKTIVSWDEGGPQQLNVQPDDLCVVIWISLHFQIQITEKYKIVPCQVLNTGSGRKTPTATIWSQGLLRSYDMKIIGWHDMRSRWHDMRWRCMMGCAFPLSGSNLVTRFAKVVSWLINII